MASKKRNNNNLLDQEQLFCDHYLVNKCTNGTASAIAAGYSAKTATVTASQLLTRPNVKTYITAQKEKQTAKSGITVERILQGLARMAFFDPRNLYKPDGSLKSIHELDDDTALALDSIEYKQVTSGKGRTKQTTLTGNARANSREKAYDMLSKYMKLYGDAPVLNVNLEAKKVTFK